MRKPKRTKHCLLHDQPCCIPGGSSSWNCLMMKLSNQVEKSPFGKRDRHLSLDSGGITDRRQRESPMLTGWATLSKNMYNQNKHQDSDSSKPVKSQGTGTQTGLLHLLSGPHEEKEQISQVLFHVRKTAGCGSVGYKERLCRSSPQPPSFLWHSHWTKCLLGVPRKTMWSF